MTSRATGAVKTGERAEKKTRSTLTESQYAAAQEVASRVYAGSMKRAAGVAALADKHGLNQTTARYAIDIYQRLLQGTVFTRAMSAESIASFIERIAIEHGPSGRACALVSLRAHLACRPNKKIQAWLQRFERQAAAPIDRTRLEFEQDFADQVERSLRDTQAERLARLAHANKSPATTVVQTRVFLRNPDVVAASLTRASGACERCRRDAPFRRAKDGTPYLEVHHKVHLAQGGEDTFENAIALCPNCHRESHHGSPDA